MKLEPVCTSLVEVSLSAPTCTCSLAGSQAGPQDPSTEESPGSPQHQSCPRPRCFDSRRRTIRNHSQGLRRLRDHRMETEGAWPGGEWQGPSRWERGYIQAVGSLPSPTYLFIFPTVPGRGWPQGLGGRGGRAEGEGGRGGGLERDRSGVLAGSRRAGARLRCVPPLLRVGDPAEAGVTMQRKARVAGRGREQQGLGGSGFCRTRDLGAIRPGAVRATVLNPCASWPVQPPALGLPSLPARGAREAQHISALRQHPWRGLV